MSAVRSVAKYLARRIGASLPPPLRRLFGRKMAPPLGSVDFGDFRHVLPIGANFGYDRGTPIDRFFIEDFLASHAVHIRGRVLEIGDNEYTLRFGKDNVSHSEVLNYTA